MAKELVDAEPGRPSRSLTATIVPALGLFYDRENSLLFSVIVAPRKDNEASINISDVQIRPWPVDTRQGLYGSTYWAKGSYRLLRAMLG